MTFTRAFYSLGAMNRYLYTRVVMSQLYFPKNSTTDLFVARIPVDEGLTNVGDVEVVLDIDTKSLILVAKRHAASTPGSAQPLETPEETDSVLEPIYDRESGLDRTSPLREMR